MSDPKYLKSSCTACGNHVEFPVEAAGQKIDCPHCGKPTVLTAEVPKKLKSAPMGLPVGVLGMLCFLILAAGGGTAYVLKKKQSPGEPEPKVVAKVEMPATNSAPVAPKPKPPPEPEPVVQPIPKTPKLLSDLKIGAITLEKTAGSSLVYAMGTVRNDSDHQRFGVSIELNLLDKQGKKISTSKDYTTVIEPRKEWKFRAMVLDPKTVTSASVASIKEEE